MNAFSRKDLFLLFMLVMCWGVSWPVMKIGVLHFPPLAFRVMGMMLGLPAIWLVARMQGISLRLPPGQLRTVIRLALPNMILWNVFIILGVKLLSSGRAAILGYTMPVWALLCGLLFFGERVTRLAWVGVGCALAGALLLLSNEFAMLAGRPLGSLLALMAAACWGYGTVLMKRTHSEMPNLTLTFWMLAVAVPVFVLLSAIFEGHAWRLPDRLEWGAIVFNGWAVFGFAYVVWFRLARTLPPVASSLSVMMSPVIGVFSGAWLLHEQLRWQDYGAMLLILAAMGTVLLKRDKPARI